MRNNAARNARIAAAVLAPFFALAGPATAMAATGPGANDPGQNNYQSTETSTTRDGVMTTQTDSCMGPDGQVSYQRSTSTAMTNGKSHTTTNSGASDCADQQGAIQQGAIQPNNAVRAIPASPVGNQPNAAGSPLIVINNPTGR